MFCIGNSEESKPCGSDTELKLADEGLCEFTAVTVTHMLF